MLVTEFGELNYKLLFEYLYNLHCTIAEYVSYFDIVLFGPVERWKRRIPDFLMYMYSMIRFIHPPFSGENRRTYTLLTV
jgi:hypothetical protein